MRDKKVVLLVFIILSFNFTTVYAKTVWSNCVPVSTATYEGRVHVKCAASVSGGIVYFAIDSKKADYANRFMALVNTALVAGKTLTINYDPTDIGGKSFGCSAATCRKVIGITMQ